jgi:hypothetical protein
MNKLSVNELPIGTRGTARLLMDDQDKPQEAPGQMSLLEGNGK